jgi:hypothetical protein
MTSMEYEDSMGGGDSACDAPLDYMNTKSILTDFILNYPHLGSKVANTIVFPSIDYMVSLLNYAFANSSNTNLNYFTLTVKGGLATNRFLSDFKSLSTLDSIDIKTIEELISKITDYDTTITLRKGSRIPENFPGWENLMMTLFSTIEKEFLTNPKLFAAVSLFTDKLQSAISTTKIKIEGIKYNGFPVSNIPEFEKLFPDSCKHSSYNPNKTFRTDLEYSNKKNLYLVFKSNDRYVWENSENQNKSFPSSFGLTFAHKEIRDSQQKLLFVLDRILGNLSLYEKDEKTFTFRPAVTGLIISNNKRVGWTYNFEVLDVSVNADYESVRDESKLGTIDIEVNNSMGSLVNNILDIKEPVENKLKINVLNISSIIYDSYIMFSEARDKVSKPEKRCKRLFIFLRVYNIIKKNIYDNILLIPNLNIPIIQGEDMYSTIDKSLILNPDQRDLIASVFPVYDQIQGLEYILGQKGQYTIFLENIKKFCYDVKSPELILLRNQVFKEFENRQSLFSEFITKSVQLFDIIKDGTSERILRDSNTGFQIQKDIDYFARLILYNNIKTWFEVSEKMKQIYGGSPYNHGGVKFVKDVLDSNFPKISNTLTSDILHRIRTFVENKILISYDIDTFIVEDENQQSIENKVNRVLQQQYSFPLIDRDSYNWEFLTNIEDIGIYKNIDYFGNPVCSGKEDNKCYMFFYKDNLYTPERGFLPFTVIRCNLIMRHKYCDIFYIANTVDFNIINKTQAIQQIKNKNLKVAFQLSITLLLESKQITLDEYLYLTSLYWFRNSEKPYNRLIRAFFYGVKCLGDRITNTTYPFELLDNKIYSIFTGNVDMKFLAPYIQQIRLTLVEISGILKISAEDILKEVVNTSKLSDLYPTCKNPI